MRALTLREILTLDAMAEAEPLVLAGGELLDRPVRWVHSSEIYEIGPLLSGGELLLTTGLGLAGTGPGARRHWVRELAAREVAGVAFEVGRSLPDVPAEVVHECHRAGLPLMALRRVVPFVRITEVANTAIVTRGLVRRLHAAPDRAGYAAALLGDLAEGRPVARQELAARAALAGFRAGPGHRVVGVAARGALEGPGVLAARVGGESLGLVAVPATGGRDPVRAVQELLRGMPVTAAAAGVPVAEEPRWGDSLRAARSALDLALTVRSAEPAAAGEPLITSARALALELELTRGGVEANRERLAVLVDQTLGPLVAWETAHGSDLVRTLEAHLRHGCSPTRTAALLHLGRQSLYQRLERIESLLGVAVTDPELHSELLIAACAHRLLGLSGRRGTARPASAVVA